MRQGTCIPVDQQAGRQIHLLIPFPRAGGAVRKIEGQKPRRREDRLCALYGRELIPNSCRITCQALGIRRDQPRFIARNQDKAREDSLQRLLDRCAEAGQLGAHHGFASWHARTNDPMGRQRHLDLFIELDCEIPVEHGTGYVRQVQ